MSAKLTISFWCYFDNFDYRQGGDKKRRKPFHKQCNGSPLLTDKENALRRECTFKIETVLEIGVAGVNIYLKVTDLTHSDVLARLAQSVRPW